MWLAGAGKTLPMHPMFTEDASVWIGGMSQGSVAPYGAKGVMIAAIHGLRFASPAATARGPVGAGGRGRSRG
jgi:hypothetical protein